MFIISFMRCHEYSVVRKTIIMVPGKPQNDGLHLLMLCLLFLIKLLMCVVSYYELSLRAAMEKALIFSREPVYSHPYTEAIFVRSMWKCNEVHILISI